jgi:hypothetical protein
MTNKDVFKITYPHLNFNDQKPLILHLWKEERARKRKGNAQYRISKNVEDIPDQTFVRLIRSRSFVSKNEMFTHRGRPRRYVTVEAKANTAIFKQAQNLLEKRLSLGHLCVSGTHLYATLPRKQLSFKKPRVLCACLIKKQRAFSEVRALASMNQNQGFGARMMDFVENMGRPIFLYSSKQSKGFYIKRGFKQTRAASYIRRCLRFSNATAMLKH